MGNINHLRLVVTGKRKTADLANELWQFGLNWMPTLGSAMADIHTPAGAFDASYDLATTSGTGYVGERNFLLEGGVTDIDPMDWLDDQVRPAVIAYLNTTGLFHSDIYVSNLECWPIGNDGNVIALPVGPAKASITPTVNTWDGQSTNAVLAPFTSFAVSTVTSANIPRGRGRFYPLPYPRRATRTPQRDSWTPLHGLRTLPLRHYLSSQRHSIKALEMLTFVRALSVTLGQRHTRSRA